MVCTVRGRGGPQAPLAERGVRRDRIPGRFEDASPGGLVKPCRSVAPAKTAASDRSSSSGSPALVDRFAGSVGRFEGPDRRRQRGGRSALGDRIETEPRPATTRRRRRGTPSRTPDRGTLDRPWSDPGSDAVIGRRTRDTDERDALGVAIGGQEEDHGRDGSVIRGRGTALGDGRRYQDVGPSRGRTAAFTVRYGCSPRRERSASSNRLSRPYSRRRRRARPRSDGRTAPPTRRGRRASGAPGGSGCRSSPGRLSAPC